MGGGWSCRFALPTQPPSVKLGGAGIDSLHFDGMDGRLVPNLSFSADLVCAIRATRNLPIHVHAMVERPEAYVETVTGAESDLFVFHIEAARIHRDPLMGSTLLACAAAS